MQQIKDVIDDGELGEPGVLQFLKVGPAGFVHCNDLAIKDSFFQLQPFQGFRNVRIFGRVVQAGHGIKERGAAINYGDDAIAVLLRFVDPGVTFRQLGNALTFHRFDEARTRFGMQSDTLNHVTLAATLFLIPSLCLQERPAAL